MPESHRRKFVDGSLTTAEYADSSVTPAKLDPMVLKYVDVTVTSAQLLALNATPQTAIAAPGANKAIIPVGIIAYKAAGAAYAGIASGEDLSFKYTNSSGAEIAQMETTGFLDQTTAQTRF